MSAPVYVLPLDQGVELLATLSAAAWRVDIEAANGDPDSPWTQTLQREAAGIREIRSALQSALHPRGVFEYDPR